MDQVYFSCTKLMIFGIITPKGSIQWNLMKQNNISVQVTVYLLSLLWFCVMNRMSKLIFNDLWILTMKILRNIMYLLFHVNRCIHMFMTLCNNKCVHKHLHMLLYLHFLVLIIIIVHRVLLFFVHLSLWLQIHLWTFILNSKQ